MGNAFNKKRKRKTTLPCSEAVWWLHVLPQQELSHDTTVGSYHAKDTQAMNSVLMMHRWKMSWNYLTDWKQTCIHRLQSSNPQGTRHTLKQASQDEAFERRLMKAIRLWTGWIKKDIGAGSGELLTGEVGKAMLPWGKLPFWSKVIQSQVQKRPCTAM